MIEGTRPYSEYQAVSTRARNVQWLASLPAHWDLRGSKWLFRTRDERARPDDEQLSATQAYGVILQKSFEEKVGRKVTQILQHLDKRRHVEVDDFVISMRSFQGGLERAWNSGAIRSSYVVLQPTTPIDVGYFSYLFKCTDYIAALQRTSSFIRDGQDLNFNNFRMVDLPVVPLEEQRAISKFLDHADRRIRRYIRAKQKLIKLLEEQKQAIIHQAVTRGLNPDVKLKPSGVPWLGDVPEHWEVVKLKFLARATGGMTPSKSEPRYWGGDIPWVSPKDMKRRFIGESIDSISEEALVETGVRLVEPGAVLIVVRGMILARRFPVAVAVASITLNQDMKALRFNKEQVPEYFCYLFEGAENNILSLAEEAGHGTRCLRTDSWENMYIPVPSPSEQQAIVEHLDSRLTLLNRSESQAQKEIDLLREYRTRLISDVVTGKLDVRQAAASLPDDLGEDEPVPDSEEELDEELEEAGEEGDE